MSSHFSSIGLGCSLALALVACGGTGGGTPVTGDGGTACSTTGTGTLTVTITGLPASAKAGVTLAAPSGKVSTVDATQTITPADAGNFTVTAPHVIVADPIVRTVYEATVSAGVVCVSNGQTATVTITYAPIPTSNKLWALNGTGGNGSMLGFASSTLAMTGAPPATVAANGPAGKAVAFDKDGNLWAMGATVADPNLVRYPASAFASGGTKTPDRSIVIKDLACSPATANMAFDATGDLWVSSGCDKSVMRFPSALLAASGTVTPSVKLTGFTGPTGVAFDASGNLWIGDESLDRFDKSTLAASGSMPSAKLTVMPPGVGGSAISADQLAFDKDGNLWVSDFAGDSISKLPSGTLGAATSNVTATVQVNMGVGALIDGMAFDEGGGIWLTYVAGKIAHVDSMLLGVSTTGGAPTKPDVDISSPDVGYAGALAFYPSATGTPLFAAKP